MSGTVAHIPSPLGRLPIAWVVVAAMSVPSQQPPARLLWRTEGAAGASDIYRGGQASRQTCSAAGEEIPSHNSSWHLPSPPITAGWGAVTCEGIQKQLGEEFGGLWLQLVRRNNVACCRWVNRQPAGSSERNVISLLPERFVSFGLPRGLRLNNAAANPLWPFKDKQHFEYLCMASKWNLSTSLKKERI